MTQLVEDFESAFHRLLTGEQVDLYAPANNLSLTFEFVATRLLADVPSRAFHWYDGVVGLIAYRRKQSQIEFTGQMWVADERNQWKENFRARVTDKRVTKEGIEIVLWLGKDRAEGKLQEVFAGS